MARSHATDSMAIGWFFKPDQANLVNALSPMAMSFLLGYNIDIFFSLKDRFINMVSRQDSKDSDASD